ncbi:hypothetical protein GOC49_11910 [Sinorhizobium meliloti]|nr:hypothetical protein [Sinorhizobium meliloti]MDX0584565.1 hypothetical protein [Sinorhizobium medicae]
MSACPRDIGLSTFITEFSLSLPRLDSLREGIDLYGAIRFSPFVIFDPDENALSRVVAELFDPLGTHGQGLLFLNALLASIDMPRLNRLDAVKVRREAMTRARRRIDIVIETARYVIGIENKPWAAQQNNQLADYHAELAADLRGRRPVLIFLSDQEEQSGHGSVIKIPYFADGNGLSLHRLLSSVVGEIKAGSPRDFVADFLRYIETNFGSGSLDDQAGKPYRNAVDAEFDDASKRKAIASILLSQEMLHLRVMREIGEYLLTEVKAKISPDFEAASDTDVEAVLGLCLYEQYTPWGVRRSSWPKNCLVAVESQRYFFSDIVFGVKAPDIKKMVDEQRQYGSPARKKLDNMTATIPGGRKTSYWPWMRTLNEPYWGQEFAARIIMDSPTSRVEAHPEIQDLARQFVEMVAIADRLLEE